MIQRVQQGVLAFENASRTGMIFSRKILASEARQNNHICIIIIITEVVPEVLCEIETIVLGTIQTGQSLFELTT